MRVFEQTTIEILDYTINWGTRSLGADTIATSSWTIFPSGMSGDFPAPSYTATTATVWLSGGVAGTYYAITNTITTAGGREIQETFIINCTFGYGTGIIIPSNALTGEDGSTILVGEDGTTILTQEN